MKIFDTDNKQYIFNHPRSKLTTFQIQKYSQFYPVKFKYDIYHIFKYKNGAL